MTFFFFFTQMDVHTCSLTYMPNTLHPHTNICSNSHRRVNNPGASKACTCTLLPWLHMVINDRWIQPHTSPSTSRLNNHEQSSIIKNKQHTLYIPFIMHCFFTASRKRNWRASQGWLGLYLDDEALDFTLLKYCFSTSY